jgi:hypothetical protein
LQPLDNYDEDQQSNNDQFDPYESKKISIPLDSSKFKDKDHINVDINLRLVDFMPQNGGNRSLDDFEVRHAYDTSSYNRQMRGGGGGAGGGGGTNGYFNGRNNDISMSRSLPGSSGSLNKFKPLPPLNNQQKYVNKPYSHQDTRLQHEYDSEIKSEGGLF